MSTSDLVREFHETYLAPINDGAPAFPEERLMLRLGLIVEEVAELLDASLSAPAGDLLRAVWPVIQGLDLQARDMVEVADALADIDYVVCGMALELGIPHDAVVAEVHRSNLSKLGEDGKPIYREDGKVLKGPYYFKPDVASVLEGAR